MYAVTQKDYDYPHRQRQLYAFHNEFSNIPEVIRDADGSLPSFWLLDFRDWLIGKLENWNLCMNNKYNIVELCEVILN